MARLCFFAIPISVVIFAVTPVLAAETRPAGILPPEQLEYFLRTPNRQSSASRATALYLEGLRTWPPGYEETIGQFIRNADYGNGGFNTQEWARICHVFAKHMKSNGRPFDSKIAENIAVAKVARSLVNEKREPLAIETVSLVREALKDDPMLIRAIAADTNSDIAKDQIKRLAPRLRTELFKSLRTPGLVQRQTLRAFDVFNLGDAELHAEVVKMLRTGGKRGSAALDFIFEQVEIGKPTALLDPAITKELGSANIDWSALRSRKWSEGTPDDGPGLIKTLKSFQHIAPESIPQAIAQIGTTGSTPSLAAALEALRGNTNETVTTRLLNSMTTKENVETVQQVDPNRISEWYGDRPTRGLRASFQIDAAELAAYLEKAKLQPGALAVTLSELADLNSRQALSPSVRQVVTETVENILSGPDSNSLKQTTMNAVRQMQLWSPKIEFSIVSWMKSDSLGLNSDDWHRARVVMSDGLGALVDAQARVGLRDESLGALAKAGPRPTANHQSGFANNSGLAFYQDQTNEHHLLQKWISLQEKLGPRPSVEKELIELLQVFQKSQASGTNVIPVMDVETARLLFDVASRLEPKSNEFKTSVRTVLEDARMRRAALEFAPEIFRAVEFPITDGFKSEILRYGAGKNFKIDQELLFLEYKPKSLASFLSALSKKNRDAKVINGDFSNRTAESIANKGPPDTRLFPGLQNGSVGHRRELVRHIVDAPAKARLEAALAEPMPAAVRTAKPTAIEVRNETSSLRQKCATWFAKLLPKKP